MPSFDSIINIVIPIIIVLVFAGLLYAKMKKGIDAAAGWIKGIFVFGKEKVTETGEHMITSTELVYQ